MEKVKDYKKLEHPKAILESFQIGEYVNIPSFQRNSILSTISRVIDKFPERKYSVTRIDAYGYKTTRTK
ncbi:MAG: hypothetical protein WCR45_07635 [Bacteroidaceae bacterium]